MYCTRKSLPPFPFPFLSLYKINRKASKTRKAREKKSVSGGGKEELKEVELKLCSCLFCCFGGGPGRLQGDSVRINKERGDRKEGRGVDLVPGRLFH